MKHYWFCFLLLVLFAGCKKDPYLKIEGNTVYSLSADQVMLLVHVNTNCETWEFDTGGAEWLRLENVLASELTFHVTANMEEQSRTAVVSFYAPSKASAEAMAELTINQAGRPQEPRIDVDDTFLLEAGPAELNVPVQTNQVSWEWEQMDESTWLAISAAKDVLYLEASENTSEDQRSTRIRIYAPGKMNTQVFKDIQVSQRGMNIDYDPVDLSESGSSNCYMIKHKGIHSFDATVRGNGKSVKGLEQPSPLAPSGARLIWQTEKGMIKSVSCAEGRITFEAARIPGNALIAATDAAGNVIWSWHIWYPQREPEALRCQTGDEMMDMNLGALEATPSSIRSHGMLYQWGRKDPFPYSPVASNGSIVTLPIKVYDIDGNAVEIGHTSMYSTVDNTLEFSVANPAVCISNNNQYSACRDWLTPSQANESLWGNPDGAARSNGSYLNTGSKSYYDPCPAGWRVPPVRDFYFFTESGGYTWASGDTQEGLEFFDLGGPAEVAVVDVDEDGKYTINDYKDGWFFYLDKSSGRYSYFPAATRYDGQYAMLMGSMVGLWANYWTNSAAPGEPYLALAMSFSIKDYNKEWNITISPTSNGSRADAYSVRCIKE